MLDKVFLDFVSLILIVFSGTDSSLLGQAKALLRIFLFLIIWLSAWVGITFPLFRRFQWRPFKIISPGKKLLLLLPLYLLAPLIVWGANVFFKQRWSEIGVILSIRSIRSLIYGVGIAVAGLSLLLLLKKLFRLTTTSAQDNADLPERQYILRYIENFPIVLGLLIVGIGIGGIEELVFRGWMLTQLENMFSPWLAAGISSIIFALAHLIWEGRSGLFQQPGLWILGWVFVISRWADGGNLALAWGLHTGWVWGLACMDALLPLQPADQKPVWLVGRAHQPMTSVLDLLLLLMTAGVVWWGYRSWL